MTSTTIPIATPLPDTEFDSELDYDEPHSFTDQPRTFIDQPLATAPPPPHIENNYEPPPSYISSTTPQAHMISQNNISSELAIPQTYNVSYTNPPNPLNPLNKDTVTITETHYIESPPENAKLQRTWRYGKTTNLLSIIDAFFCILTGLVGNPYLLFIAILPISGYYGSKEYSLVKTGIYIVYIFSICFFKSIDIYNIVDRNYDYLSNSSNNTIIGLTVLNGIYLFIELWIFKVVIKFHNCLIRLTGEELTNIRLGNYKPFVTTYKFT